MFLVLFSIFCATRAPVGAIGPSTGGEKFAPALEKTRSLCRKKNWWHSAVSLEPNHAGGEGRLGLSGVLASAGSTAGAPTMSGRRTHRQGSDQSDGKQGSHLSKVLLQRVHTDSPVREVRSACALPLQALLGGLPELVLLGAASGAGGAREDFVVTLGLPPP